MYDKKVNELLNKLAMSKFRSSFKLNDNDKKYIEDKELELIEEHAYDFIKKRISPKVILNDGKQTPMRGHPVFKAQHATATCCRGCLYKWHRIEMNKDLSKEEQKYIVKIIMEWIKRQVN